MGDMAGRKTTPREYRVAVFTAGFLRRRGSIELRIGDVMLRVPILPGDTGVEFAARVVREWNAAPRRPRLYQRGPAVFVRGRCVRHILITGRFEKCPTPT